jgi:hypothetical protein
VRGKAVRSLVEYAMRAKIAGVVLEACGLADARDAAWDRAAEGLTSQPTRTSKVSASGARLRTGT